MTFDKEKARKKFLEENKEEPRIVSDFEYAVLHPNLIKTPLTVPLKRAEILADKLTENLASAHPDPLYKVIMASGFSESMAKKPAMATKSEVFRRRLELNAQKAAKIMSKRRAEALQLMLEKQGEAKYRDLAYGVDIMTKNERLISGQATENIGMQGSLVMIPSKDSEFQEPQADNTA